MPIRSPLRLSPQHMQASLKFLTTASRGRATRKTRWTTCLQCGLKSELRRYYSGDNNNNNNNNYYKDSPNDPPDAELPSTAETRRHPLSARFSTFMDDLQSRALVASQHLNDLTGYSAIEAIKRRNAALETAELPAAQARLAAARRAYKQLNTDRAATQREVTTLLARKDSWTPADLERFTLLYRADHELESRVAAAADELAEAEAEEARLSAALNAGILKRYHEEQVWSDRIRRQSTWGTWGLMSVNVLIFLGFQFVAEPWKRARLVRSVAELERESLEDVRREIGDIKQALAEARLAAAPTGAGREEDAGHAVVPQSEPTADRTIAPPTVSWKDTARDPAKAAASIRDLYSERRIDLRMRDASVLVLESAAAGALLAAGLTLALFRRS